MVSNRRFSPLRELWIVVWQANDGRPHLCRGGATSLKDLEELIDIGSSRKEWHSGCHFGEYATHRPNVDCGRITVSPKKQFRGSVPKRDNFKCVRSVGYSRQTSQPEIGQFELTPICWDQELCVSMKEVISDRKSATNEWWRSIKCEKDSKYARGVTHIMGLEIAMQDPICVAKADTSQNLSQKWSHRWNRQSNAFTDVIRRLMLVHKSFQIVGNELKDEIETTRVGLNDIQ